MKSEELFTVGITAFNKKQFYDAHEYWEEIWNEYNIPDRLFIQGLIQLTVAYFHITNQNLKGAKSMFNKCLPKLSEFVPLHRGLDIKDIVDKVISSLDCIESIDDYLKFNWENTPVLKLGEYID